MTLLGHETLKLRHSKTSLNSSLSISIPTYKYLEFSIVP